MRSYLEGFSANVRRIFDYYFNRHFYRYTPPRPLEEIDTELKQADEEIMRLLREVTA